MTASLICLVLTSVVLVGNALCTIDGTDHNYNSYTCPIMQFVNGVNNLPTDGFGGSNDMCDGSWGDAVECTTDPIIKLDLWWKSLSGCPDWSIDLPDELQFINLGWNHLDCDAVDFTHLPTHLDYFDVGGNNMTGTIVWPLPTTTFNNFAIVGNYFEGSVDVSVIDAVYIQVGWNQFTSINLDSFLDGVVGVGANDNAFTGIVNLSNIPDSIERIALYNNNFTTIDFTAMGTCTEFELSLDTTVQCDASIHCATNEISADRTFYLCFDQEMCAATCVCIPSLITCPQCQKNCKTARDVCNGILDTCANSCDSIQCLK